MLPIYVNLRFLNGKQNKMIQLKLKKKKQVFFFKKKCFLIITLFLIVLVETDSSNSVIATMQGHSDFIKVIFVIF